MRRDNGRDGKPGSEPSQAWRTTATASASRLAIGTARIDRVDGIGRISDRTGRNDPRAHPDDGELEQIVHDLKGPLATIALEMSFLEEDLRAGTPPDLSGVVARVFQNVEFLDRMVLDLLDSCAIDSGKFGLHRQRTELRGLIERCVDRVVGRDLGRVSIRAPSPVVVDIDALRIERVLANLVQNALRYSAPSSGVAVQLEVLADHAWVSVTDSGRGLTADERAYIFDKYRRGSSARAHRGAGLGLYISRQIIEAHGGTISVTSAVGSGSRFVFELPIG